MEHPKDEAGGVAIVTGAGSGVGRAAARALARAGWRVVLAGRRLDALRETAEGLPDAAVRAIACDVTEPASVAALFAGAVEAFGRLDLLFNNAGVGLPPTPIEALELDAWRRVVDVNLTGAFLCAQAAVRQMKVQAPRGGRIINNGSISAQVPRPHAVAYTASKHAITGLTRSIALDGRAFDIACGQIDIGNAATPMTEAMAEGVLQPDGRVRPEPTMDVEAAARSVVHMASLPLDANVLSMTVMATGMPFAGRG